ncbi:hypothetical protein EV138_6236 [Kribbella voronezhensis]|uniref:Uncharacterized protein n=1 Tax=Kribbella voronezhensis TaxID=2512212 RepID=A0A4R7SWN9_9ACTN|nr:hypothetical protein [Kribbella voronezhensis]TDU83772.1 hypothetical protein EV138_6236 [Kribbella voronezhensis]
MGEIDNARQQREALRKSKGRPTDSGRRASTGILRYLGVNLYRERNRAAAAEKHDADGKEDSDD